MDMQRCTGCGLEESQHPFVGIAQPTPEIAPYQVGEKSARGFAAFPVCATCHRTPSNRRRTLKMAFFPAGQLSSALAEAGSNSVKAT